MVVSLTKFTWTASTLKRVLNWYPPWMGAGIRIDEISQDFRYARVSMPLTFYNRNYVNTHFGGSLYSMCDPVYMLLLLNALGKDFVVWDKAAHIDYKRPGKGTMTAEFVLEDKLLLSIRAMNPNEIKFIKLPVDVKDADTGQVVAHVVKTEYIRRKDPASRL